MIKPGKYKHYKGNFYEVIGEAFHTETDERLVVYRPLYEVTDDKADLLCVRPKDMFLETVTLPDGSQVPRFEFVE